MNVHGGMLQVIGVLMSIRVQVGSCIRSLYRHYLGENPCKLHLLLSDYEFGFSVWFPTISHHHCIFLKKNFKANILLLDMWHS